MTYKRPLRFTILHFAQRFLIDADTFTVNLLMSCRKFLIILAANPFV